MARVGPQRHRGGSDIWELPGLSRGPIAYRGFNTVDMVGLLLTFSMNTTSDPGPKISYTD